MTYNVFDVFGVFGLTLNPTLLIVFVNLIYLAMK